MGEDVLQICYLRQDCLQLILNFARSSPDSWPKRMATMAAACASDRPNRSISAALEEG